MRQPNFEIDFERSQVRPGQPRTTTHTVRLEALQEAPLALGPMGWGALRHADAVECRWVLFGTRNIFLRYIMDFGRIVFCNPH